MNNIKVGQWALDKYGNVGLVTSILENGTICFDNDETHYIVLEHRNNIVKVANTIEELKEK